MITYRGRLFIGTCAVLTALIVLLPFHRRQLFLWTSTDADITTIASLEPDKHNNVEIVVASIKSEDASWLTTYFPDWKTNIYITDNPNAALTVPKNKGRESMAYLTHIINNYDNLPDNLIFFHASRFAWHNDDPDYDAAPTLQNFQLPYLQESGYVNLRCVWVIGCPIELRPIEDEANRDESHPATKDVYKQSLEELLPELPIPAVVAVSCCSQFGVTRHTIRRRPKEDYVRYRQWLIDTPLGDDRSGRVFEFSWHSKSILNVWHSSTSTDTDMFKSYSAKMLFTARLHKNVTARFSGCVTYFARMIRVRTGIRCHHTQPCQLAGHRLVGKEKIEITHRVLAEIRLRA